MKAFHLFYLFIVFGSAPAFSAGSELSLSAFFVQAFNFSLFAGAFFFLLKNPVQAFFHQRQKSFFDFEKQAIQIEKEKKAENETWKKRLSELEEKEKNIEAQAKEQAQKFKELKQKELEELHKSLKSSSDFLIRLEAEKSKKDSLLYWRKKLVERSGKELSVMAQSKEFQDKESNFSLELLEKTL